MTVVENKSKSIVFIVIASAVVGVAAGVIGTMASRSPTTHNTVAEIQTAPNESVKTEANNVRADKATPVPVPAKEQKETAKAEPARVATVTPASVCKNCGVVKSVKKVVEKGETSGGGAVAGGVIGGVVGHQFGKGQGKDLATAIGVVGGALTGNAIEKNAKEKVSYRVIVEMNDGRREQFTLEQAPTFVAGSKVKIVNGQPVGG